MSHRSKRLRAFTTGCLVSLITFGYPSQLLASMSESQDIDGVSSTVQYPPSTVNEVEDAAAAVAAGLNPIDAIEPKPVPLREYTAFLVNIWDALFSSHYQTNASFIRTGEWLHSPSGSKNAVNESGDSVALDIALSLEILPDQWDEIDQATRDLFSSVSARMGIAWIKMESNTGNSINVSTVWVQWFDSDGPQTLVFPMNVVSQAELDTYEEIIPLMDGFFDDPLNYNIDNYDPSTLGLLRSFRNTVRNAVVGVVVTAAAAVGAVAGAVITAAVTPGATLAVVAAAAAGPLVAAVVVVGVAVAVGYYVIQNARDELENDLNNQGYNTTNASYSDLIELAKISDAINGF